MNSNSNSFIRVQVRVRVQKKYFFEFKFKFEFGKMIEFYRVRVQVRVRSPDKYASFKIIEYEYPKPEYEVLEYFFTLFKIINIRLIFYECLKQFLRCHESMINKHFLQLMMQNKNKNFIGRINETNSDAS